jgi:cytochrome P450
LRKYYNAGYDSWPGVAQLTKGHANQFRNYNIKPDLIGDFELSLIHVSTLNAIPTLFWNLLHIASDPVLTEEIRQELLSIIRPGIPLSNGKRGIEIDITKFEDSCPLLVSSYRETIRLANGQLSTRRVVRDTMISDGKNSYLLKKGADVMMPSAVTHLSTDIWGPNAHKFDATRFMTKATTDEKEKEEERERRRAYFPFGGGKHLCPGRNFASAEILGTITALLLGFDIKSAEGGLIQVPELRRARIGEAVGKPQLKGQHIGARLERRAGWEDVVWKFVC